MTEPTTIRAATIRLLRSASRVALSYPRFALGFLCLWTASAALRLGYKLMPAEDRCRQ